jgi:hypothetical protein
MADASVEVVVGSSTTAASPTDLAAYRPVAELAPHETLIVGIGGTS